MIIAKLQSAIFLDQQGSTAKSLDIIADCVMDAIEEGRFEKLNEALMWTDVKCISVQVMVGLLSFTLMAHNELPYRGEFFKMVSEEIENREGSVPSGLLIDLEGGHAESARKSWNLINNVIIKRGR